MRFKINVNGHEVILTAEQLEVVSGALYRAEKLTTKSLKKSDGTGYDYISVLADEPSRDWFTVTVMPAEQYDALVFITKMQNEKEAK